MIRPIELELKSEPDYLGFFEEENYEYDTDIQVDDEPIIDKTGNSNPRIIMPIYDDPTDLLKPLDLTLPIYNELKNPSEENSGKSNQIGGNSYIVYGIIAVAVVFVLYKIFK